MNANHDRWEERYRNSNLNELPWYSKDLDPDLEKALRERDLHSGALLDVGTGPGTHAAALSRIGFQVTACDLSETAVTKARESQGENPNLRFFADDILNSALSGPFDLAFDRGCFHVLTDEERLKYAASLHRLLRPGGCLFLKCFSDREPPGEGPRRIRQDELREVFADQFQFEEIRETVFQGNRKPNPKALFSIMRRT